MNDKPNPLSAQSILSFVVANLSLGVLVGWAADIIQIITIKSGLFIFGALVLVSVIVLVVRSISYYNSKIVQYEQQIEKEKARSAELKSRLDKLVMEFRSRSTVNPIPTVVNALIYTRRLESVSLNFGIIDITPKLIVIDKGELHGLTYGMCFAVCRKSNNELIERCVVDRVENSVSWLAHSGSKVSATTTKDDLVINLVHPPEVGDSEREIAKILMIAEGF